MNILRSLIIALSMYTRIPMPQVRFEKASMKYVMCFFPVAGIVIGAAEWGWFYIGAWLEAGGVLRTAGSVLIPILITGGIHMDGFMDTADARSSYASKEKKLDILKDPHAGAFAVLFCVCYFIGSFAVWSEITPELIGVCTICFVLSRALSAFAVVQFVPAKKDGLAASFEQTADKKKVISVLILYILGCASTVIYLNLAAGLACLTGAGLVFLYYRIRIIPEFGGVTGDLAGWFLQMSEMIMLLLIVMTKYIL